MSFVFSFLRGLPLPLVRFRTLVGAGLLLFWVPWIGSSDLSAQLRRGQGSPLPADSTGKVRAARDAQRQFEDFRVSRIPPQNQTVTGRCDVRIGRLCHWYGGAQEADFPPELPEVSLARRDLLGTLQQIRESIGDPWVLGQIVHYLIEEDRVSEARRVAAECGLEPVWWCHALEGYVLHLLGDFSAAEESFHEGLRTMPDRERGEWITPRYLLSPDADRTFRRASAEDQSQRWERLWRFSDPLFLVEGNDRYTDHFARLTLARIRREAANPHGMAWDQDLEEALIRYGRTIGWSRTRGTVAFGAGIQDNRQVVSHHHPASRGYLFSEEFLEAPADIPPEAWITTPREARTWYAAPYAPDFRGLETQVARFRRGDSLLVVGAYRPDPASPLAAVAPTAPETRDPFGSWDPFGGGGGAPPERSSPDRASDPPSSGPVEAALFLVPEDGGEIHSTRGSEREGVFMLTAPTGRYVSSLELLDRPKEAAWRARQGITQVDLPRGIAALSDLLILREGAELPNSLEEALPLVRPGVRIQSDERFTLAWEIYGLGVEEPARITLGFTRGRPGFLRRVGEFVGVLETDAPVEISFDETGPESVQVLFRALEMRLPSLAPGEYTLHVRLDLPGREPSIASRPIWVEREGR